MRFLDVLMFYHLCNSVCLISFFTVIGLTSHIGARSWPVRFGVSTRSILVSLNVGALVYTALALTFDRKYIQLLQSNERLLKGVVCAGLVVSGLIIADDFVPALIFAYVMFCDYSPFFVGAVSGMYTAHHFEDMNFLALASIIPLMFGKTQRDFHVMELCRVAAMSVSLCLATFMLSVAANREHQSKM